MSTVSSMFTAVALAALWVLSGCGDDAAADGAGGAGTTASTASTGAGAVVETFSPDAPPLPGQDTCVVTVTTDIPIPSAEHLEPCTEVSYPTNPPSGGDHWRVWAAFATYEDPVPRGMLVHALEHGAIALLHDAGASRDEVLTAFGEATNAHGADNACLAHGTVARFIVAPDPELDTPVALAAWGATYVATCIDMPSLTAFVAEHYAQAPEDTCFPGVLPSSIDCD